MVAGGGALLVAHSLDSPVGEGARDEAQPAVPGPAVVPDAALAGNTSGLPPLAMVLDRPPPDGIAKLPPIRQAARLQDLAGRTAVPRRFVELGAVLQLLGDTQGAQSAYESALRRAPGDLAARTGLAMIAGADGDPGLARASADLGALARQNPRSQLVAFNQGWVEIYRRQAAPARDAWRRTIALGAHTRLGATAEALLRALEKGASGRRP